MDATCAGTQVSPYYLNAEAAAVQRVSAKRDDFIFRRGSKRIRRLLIWQIFLTLYLRYDSSSCQKKHMTVSITLRLPNTTKERFSMENASINPEHVKASVQSGYQYACDVIEDPECPPDDFVLIAFTVIYNHHNVNHRIIPHDSAEFVTFTSMVSQELAKHMKGISAESIQEAILKGNWK